MRQPSAGIIGAVIKWQALQHCHQASSRMYRSPLPARCGYTKSSTTASGLYRRSKPRASALSDSAVASERLAGDEAIARGCSKIRSGQR